MNMARGTVSSLQFRKNKPKKKHITPLIANDHVNITDPKEILEEEERFFKQIYTSKNMNPNGSEFKEFFKTENVLSEETAKTCEGIMSIVECERSLKMMESNKTPGTDGLTSEFYRYFWNTSTAGKFMAKCILTYVFAAPNLVLLRCETSLFVFSRHKII